MKLIREGMEDYEYLVQAAAIDDAKARQIALALFPTAYECNQPVAAFESARDQLFAMLDKPVPPQSDGGVGSETYDDGGATSGGGSGGCGCTTSGDAGVQGLWLGALALAFKIVRRASRRRSKA